MNLETLVAALGRQKANFLAKLAEKGIDKRGLEMMLNHNIVAVRYSGKDGKDAATWCCSNTIFIHRYNAFVDTQFQKDPKRLPEINSAGLVIRNPKALKSWNLLTNWYCEIPIDNRFLLLNFEPLDVENIGALNEKARNLVSHMRAGIEEVRIR